MKIKKKIILLILIFIVGGLGGIVANRYAFPYFASVKLFRDSSFFKKISDQVTVINRTEQVYIKEEFSLEKVTGQVSSSIVSVIIYPLQEKNYFKNNIIPEEPIKNSGIIATSDGVIITYMDPAIVVNAGNRKYKIIIGDGSSYDAEFLGLDSYSNLAFLKINAGNLTAVSFADSNNDRPGEKIVVAGADEGKFHLQYASGLLSQIDERYNLAGKTLSSSEKMEGIFKADFNLNNDYIGGPVVDYSGQAIGIIGAVKKDNALNFFIIPSNEVRKVLDKAIKKELESNSTLGIYYVPLSKDYSTIKGISREAGALIYSPSGQQGLAVIAGTPADKAGLKINDTIIAVNGEEINLENPLPALLYKYKKGQEIELNLIRDNKDVKIKVSL